MRIRILGSSGGIGKGLKTTSILIDGDILLDAGTGVGDLTLDEMRGIRHIFLTHSHLDHLASIPLLIDTLFNHVDQAVMVYGRQETIDALREHIFNWTIWPDFSILPNEGSPVMAFDVLPIGEVVELKGRQIEIIDVNHSVPAAAYRISEGDKAFAFSGDTTTNDSLWKALNEYNTLDLLIVESAFPNSQLELAKLAHHYCPSLLAEDLQKLRHRPRTCITHTMPGEEQIIMQQCHEALPKWDLHLLSCGDVFEI